MENTTIIQVTLLQVIAMIMSILGPLLLIAWHGGSRFSKIENDINWLKDGLIQVKNGFEKAEKTNSSKFTEINNEMSELRIVLENKKTHLYVSRSPIQLTENGRKLLEESGLKDYIDSHEGLITEFDNSGLKNPYEIQKFAFKLLDTLPFDQDFDNTIKQYAYDSGLSLEIIRRVGALYFRDLCLKRINLLGNDIDRHTSNASG